MGVRAKKRLLPAGRESTCSSGAGSGHRPLAPPPAWCLELGVAVKGVASLPSPPNGDALRLSILSGEAPRLETADEVRAYLDACGGVRERLLREWYAPDGELRPCYGKAASGAWLRGG